MSTAVAVPSLHPRGDLQPPSRPPPISRPPTAASRTVKTFAVTARKPTDFGAKIALYGAPGSGKSTLASMAPGAVFIDLDRGTVGLKAQVIEGIESFEDLRVAVQQAPSLIPEKGTLVLDTVSKVDELLTAYLLKTTNKQKIKELSYDRFPSAVEAFRSLLFDLDGLIRARRNVILCAHAANISVSNALGTNYEQEGPKLTHSRLDSCRDEMVGWADHVFRIAYEEVAVSDVVERGGVRKGKVQNMTTVRQIYTEGSAAMVAKSRPVSGQRIPPVIAFNGPEDDSLWKFLFGAA